jgi:hypothetical protein
MARCNTSVIYMNVTANWCKRSHTIQYVMYVMFLITVSLFYICKPFLYVEPFSNSLWYITILVEFAFYSF